MKTLSRGFKIDRCGETLPSQTKISLLALLCGLTIFIASTATSKAQLLIDTGPGFGREGLTMDFRQVAPTPFGGGFEWLAARVAFDSTVRIASIEVYLQQSGYTGFGTVSIRSDTGGLPGALLFSDVFSAPAASSPSWNGVFSETWDLSAGKYWITFTPAPSSLPPIFGFVPTPALYPLEDYAIFEGLLQWRPIPQTFGFGVRVFGAVNPGSPVPESSTMGFCAAIFMAGLAYVRFRRGGHPRGQG